MFVPRYFSIAASGLLLLCSLAHADVHLPSVFGNQMVLQRGIPLPVWGTADPGESVEITIADQKADAVADKDGKWEIKLQPLTPVDTPLQMTVKASNRVVFEDILVGDVWVCSGQSNMEWPLQKAHNAAEAIPAASHPKLRLFSVKKNIAFEPQTNCEGNWTDCTPESVAKFSAVGYFFGKELLETQQVPIGLIGTYWGGTPAQAWTSLQALEANPELAQYAEQFKKTKTELPDLVKKFQDQELPKWQTANDAWQKMAEAAKAEGKEPEPAKAPRQPRPPDGNPGLATVLYNGMIAPILPFGIKGAIWYQGEANAGRAEEYATLFPAMITDWRSRWSVGDFPFLFVQLAAFEPGGANWPVLRNSQTKTLSLPNTGMAVTIDIGEPTDIHPTNKLDVGHRLALAARADVYGEEIEFSGPMYESMEVADGEIRVSFSHAKDGLKIGSNPVRNKDDEVKPPLDHLVGFEIAGPSGEFVEASAAIDGENVVVSSDAVSDPKAVRYAWAAYPDVNLYNASDLPAVPFSTAEE